MALKPCPGGVSNVLFTIGSIDLGYCNVRGGGTAREKAANGDGQQQGQTRPHDPVTQHRALRDHASRGACHGRPAAR